MSYSNYDNYGRKKSDNRVSVFFQYMVIFICVGLFIFGLFSFGGLFQEKDAYETVRLDYGLAHIVADSTGKGVWETSNKALCSKNPVSCTGFIIQTKFETRVDYEIHFFTADDKYIGYKRVSDEGYSVDVGDMPLLKDLSGSTDKSRYDLDSDLYKNADTVLDENGKVIVADYIHIVIKPQGATDNMFTSGLLGLQGAIQKGVFANGLTLRITQKVPSIPAA